ncbi:MAG: NfeD family protein [Bacteroidales bacterium]|nr:NfeD family protein [Bacteroidales bacterium]
MEMHYYWLIAAILLIIIEIFTAGFGALCFAFGALGSALASWAGLSMSWQLVIFAVISLLAFVFVRPFVLKFLTRKNQEVKTNADALIGRKAIVTERIDPVQHSGRVKVDGDEWKAVSENGTPIESGAEVEITARESIIVTVRR